MTEKEFRKLRRQDLLELLLEQGKEAAKLADLLTETENSLEQRNVGYERLKAKLEEKDAQIERLKHRLDEKDFQINKLKKRLDEKDAKISRLRGETPEAGEIPKEEQLTEKQSEEQFTEKPPEEQIAEKQPEESAAEEQSKKVEGIKEERSYEDDFDLKDDFDDIEWLVTEPEKADEGEEREGTPAKRKKFWRRRERSRRKAE